MGWGKVLLRPCKRVAAKLRVINDASGSKVTFFLSFFIAQRTI